MMSIFKKSLRVFSRRVCPVLFSIVLVSVLSAPIALADEISCSATVQTWFTGANGNDKTANTTTVSIPAKDQYIGGGSSTARYGLIPRYLTFNNVKLEKNVAVYFSWYCVMHSSSVIAPIEYRDKITNSSGYDAKYQDGDSNDIKYANASAFCNPFTPSIAPATTGFQSHTGGATVGVKFSIPDDAYATMVQVTVDPSKIGWSLGANSTGVREIYMPSIRLVSTETSAELESLEGIADGIAAQNEIMQAMYGEIIAICQSIYQNTGDMVAAQALTNLYFSQVIPILNNIQSNTGAILGVDQSIYSYLQSAFSQLIQDLDNNFDDLESLLKRQLIEFEEWQYMENENTRQIVQENFEWLIGVLQDCYTGGEAFGEDLAKADSKQAQLDIYESQYQGQMQQRFNEINASFTGFSGGALGGISLVGTLFGRVWNALGEYAIVYSFPLVFGLVLAVIGRIPRAGTKKSSDDDIPDQLRLF